MLATEHHGGYLGGHPRWRPIVDAGANVLLCPNYTAPPHIKHFRLDQLVAFST